MKDGIESTKVSEELGRLVVDFYRIKTKREKLYKVREMNRGELIRKEEELFRIKYHKISLSYTRRIFRWIEELKKHPPLDEIVKVFWIRGYTDVRNIWTLGKVRAKIF